MNAGSNALSETSCGTVAGCYRLVRCVWQTSMAPCAGNALRSFDEKSSHVHLIHLNDSIADHMHGQHNCSTSTKLLQEIRQGLLTPSVELSAAAARKLQLHHLQQDSRSAATNHSAMHHSIQDVIPSAAPEAVPTAAGRELRSLPVELLYDDAGLALFDQITYLPEYYLTAAESDILRTHGLSIVENCVPKQGALLVELGAGSMRKTLLLLDAVVASGRSDVTFCALDLCERSLNQALQTLQGVYQGSVHLVGLVGNYQQGLAYLQQQQQALACKKPDPVDMPPELLTHRTTNSAFQPNSKSTCASTTAARHHSMGGAACRPPACTGSSAGSLSDGSTSYLMCEEELLLLQPPCMDGLMLYSSSRCSSSSICTECGAEGAISLKGRSHTGSGSADGSPGAGLVQCEVNDCRLNHTEAVHDGSSSKADVFSGSCSEGKVLMWLGSSIGNLSRSEAAAFLKQLKEAAMQPGDVLLVGIDRRNAPDKIQAAYNDPAGVTRAFIMNGLKHCQQLLNKQLLDLQITLDGHTATAAAACNGKTAVASTTNNNTSSTNVTGSSSSTSSTSLNVDDFSYFCLYNEEKGRHEAYYQATRDTTILLPLAAGVTSTRAAAAAPAGPEHTMIGDTNGVFLLAPQQTSPSDCKCVGLADVVPVSAGELIHIEYSYKYSMCEVEDLAAAAGLTWVRAWADSAQQYDLHMFTVQPS